MASAGTDSRKGVATDEMKLLSGRLQTEVEVATDAISVPIAATASDPSVFSKGGWEAGILIGCAPKTSTSSYPLLGGPCCEENRHVSVTMSVVSHLQ